MSFVCMLSKEGCGLPLECESTEPDDSINRLVPGQYAYVSK